MHYMLLINSDKAAPPPQPAEMEGIMRGHHRLRLDEGGRRVGEEDPAW
jgi:hypothetical protein